MADELGGPGTLALGWRQYRLQGRPVWRNPPGALFHLLPPPPFPAAQRQLDKLVPAIAAMSVMATTFTALAYNIVFLRERGVLKRIRGTPLPTGSYFAGLPAHPVTNPALQSDNGPVARP